MPYKVPSTAELIQRDLSNIEYSLNQKTPPAEKAFNAVLAVTEGLADKGLYAFAADLIRENLALTASEEGLTKIGEEYGIYRVQPAIWEGVAIFDIPDGNTLFFGTIFIGPQNIKYQTIEPVTAPFLESGSGVQVSIVCTEAGPSGNLSAGDILTIQAPIVEAGRIATVKEVKKLGTPIEDIETFRQRILDCERSEGGGGNSSDLRSWAQGVPGVRRAYPFTGPPEEAGHSALPGERTVYIECVQEVDNNGIPPQSLLDLVRAALLIDPDSGISREILGLPGDTLYVQPVKRTGLFIVIAGMSITVGNIGDAETAVKEALAVLLETFCPFVQGLDPDFDRRDTITASVIGREVQNILDAFGGTAQNILFGTSPELFIGKYDLKRNEKLKLEDIEFLEAG